MQKAKMIVKFLAVVTILIFSFTLLITGCKISAKSDIENSQSAGTKATESVKESYTSETVNENTSETKANSSEETTISVKDGLGNEIILEKPAEKIIVFVPSALEIIDALNAMDKVIGVDNWSIDSKEPLAEGFEGFGDFQGINMEKVTAANPDLIIGLIGWAEADIQKLSELGIKLYIVQAQNIEDVHREIINMGKIIGKEVDAQKLSDEVKKAFDDVSNKVSDLKPEQKPKVFYEVWNDPLMSAGKNTFINDLINYSGGINIVAEDGLEGWPEYSVESLIKNNPDVIIAPMSLTENPDVILTDARFSEISAVKNKKVFIVPDNPVSRPSQNIVKGLNMFAKAIHPEIFGEFEAIK